MQCGVCGGTRFTSRQVLWDGLVREWQLSATETEYMNRQQGETCDSCGSNLRSIALANALRAFFQTYAPLSVLINSNAVKNASILEINEAGMLSPYLQHFGHYLFGDYPQVDIHALPFPDQSFDIVIHSDTLEHVINPVHALAECRRLLKAGGALCYTVPTITGRLSRNRAGLPKSFHGDASTSSDDFVVQTEFGADAWTYCMEAGFTDVSIHSFAYPAATAILARNGWSTTGRFMP